ncbi:MAG TPA: DUF892 family protein [Fimbriimonas sp.]|nr:DUF892 family protein [Fimbriimonas sp.]
MKDLNDLFQDTIRDIYNSEHQLLKAMAGMREKSENDQLKRAFDTHIEQTEEQIRRIEQICIRLNFQPTGKTCQGTLGIVREATEDIGQFAGSPAGDACIIACAQKAEHYEMANYGSAIAWAEELEMDDDIIDLLEQTLQEEEEADDLLTSIAEDMANVQANDTMRTAGRATVF